MRKTRSAPILALLLVAAAGCEGTAGVSGAILLKVRWGDDVPAEARLATTRIDLVADGDTRAYSWAISDLSALTPGPLTQRYRPAAKSGAILFTGTARGADTTVTAFAMNGIQIDPSSEVSLELVLHLPGSMPDGGVPDLAMPDMRVVDAGPDLRAPDLAMPDLRVPDLQMPDLRMPDLQMPDLQMPDLQMPDLQMPDLQMPDLQMPDLQMPDFEMPDLEMPDLQMPDLQMPDLVPPPDMSPAAIPSHTAARFNYSAQALNAAIAMIDTKQQALFDKNNAVIQLPQGATFTSDGKSAVLSVGSWTVAAGNNITVVGTLPLIVLASGPVTIGARIIASAAKDVPGPGGVGAGMGAGAGGATQTMIADDPGGGGAGFGTAGAAAGATQMIANAPAAGASYGALLSDWNGGSGGGTGSGYPFCQGEFPNSAWSRGGAGGGAVQISSAVSITVQNTGSVEAGGGGGRGGCSSRGEGTGGGGGGSGGTIFLEAQTITVSGGLYANGGGGGGGGNSLANNPIGGQDGADGPNSATQAAGGGATLSGGVGGTGGASGGGPTSSPTNRNSVIDSGGGGGAVGRVWLRTRGAQAMVGAVCSPTPVKDTTY